MVSATLRFLLYVTDVKRIATYKLFGALAATNKRERKTKMIATETTETTEQREDTRCSRGVLGGKNILYIQQEQRRCD